MASGARDDFRAAIKRASAERVGHRCSNPECRAQTSGPQVQDDKALNLGVAAHIAGAAPGGPRFQPDMLPEERADISNAIWLCQTCAKLIDSDLKRFTVEALRKWKEDAETEARDKAGKAEAGLDWFEEFAKYIEIVEDRPKVGTKWVDSKYPEKAGITQGLQAEGYDVRWSTDKRESERVDLEGWEYVLVEEGDGSLFRLMIRQSGGDRYLVLLKRKKK